VARGEIAINTDLCLGCSYCAHFCPKKCIVMSDKVNSQGFLTPIFAHPEECTACGICARMCPQYVIDVYKLAESKS
jgi:2-oxoglutarate ferredoxin oxidoreductase subunit delta